MRPKQCSLRAPNLRGRERGSERGRKENRTLKKRRGGEKRGESWEAPPPVGLQHSCVPSGDDNLTSHPPAHMYSSPSSPSRTTC